MENIREEGNERLNENTEEDFLKQKDEQGLKRQTSLRMLGLLSALASAFCYSFQSLIISFVAEISPLQFACIGSMGLLVSTSAILACQRRSPWLQEKRFTMFLRCIFGTASYITGNLAFRYLPLGDASVIIFSAPIFVTVFAYFILNEPFTIFHLVVNLLTLLGIILIARPPFLFGGHTYDSRDSIIGISFALLRVLFASGECISMRSLADIHYLITSFYYSVAGTIVCGALSLYLGTFTFIVTKNPQVLVFGVPLAHVLGQFLLTISLQLEDAGPVSMMRSGDIVFAFIWQYVFLGVAPNMMSIGGASLVIFAVILLGLRKVVEGAADDSKIAKNCWCFKV